MGDTVRGIIAELYDRLLLRDLFGKIVPGGIALVGAIALVGRNALPTPHSLLESANGLPLAAWLGILGLCWTLAFALQWLGERARLLRNIPKTYDRPRFYQKMAQFDEQATSRLPRQLLHAERLLVIKEACGNGGIAILFVTILAFSLRAIRCLQSGTCGVGWQTNWYPDVPVLVLALIAGVSLICMHREHVERHKDLIEAALVAGPASTPTNKGS
jgi:hypothetical protein